MACPHCGEAPFLEQDSNTYDTITGMPASSGQAAWTFQLLGEVIERALATERQSEAERMMQRAVNDMEERVRAGSKLDARHLTKIAVFALRLAQLKGQPEWAEWALNLHREHDLAPLSETLDELEKLGEPRFASLRPLLGGLALWWMSHRVDESDEQQRGLRLRMEALARQA